MGAGFGPATCGVTRMACALDRDMVDVWCVVRGCVCVVCVVYVVVDVWGWLLMYGDA